MNTGQETTTASSPDNLTPEQRRRCMSRVKARDTNVEVTIRSELHRRGLRFRKHAADLPGTPDIVFRGAKLAVFVDGDFWHGRHLSSDLAKGRLSERREFWVKKLKTNMERDQRVNAQLLASGWQVLRLWSSEVKEDPSAAADAVVAQLRAKNGSCE